MSETQDWVIDTELVRGLANLLGEARLTQIECSWHQRRVRVVRNPAPLQIVTASGPASPADAPRDVLVQAGETWDGDWEDHPGAVKSPMVGLARLAPKPGAAAFVCIGDRVARGQTVLVIEAMRVMNEFRAPQSGRVTQILVGDGDPIEFGQVLLVLE